MDQPTERNKMTSNVIAFPKREGETINTIDRLQVESDADEFAYELMETIHDVFHQKTGECIFTDEDYAPISIYLSEVISAMYMLSQGHDDHPMQEIAKDVFGNDLDIAEKNDYDGEIVDNEET